MEPSANNAGIQCVVGIRQAKGGNFQPTDVDLYLSGWLCVRVVNSLLLATNCELPSRLNAPIFLHERCPDQSKRAISSLYVIRKSNFTMCDYTRACAHTRRCSIMHIHTLASRSHAFSIRAREKGLVHCLRATCSLLQEFLQGQSDCRIVPRHVYPPTQYAGRCDFSKISTYRHASLLALALCRYLVGQQNTAKLLTYDRSTYGRQRRSLLPWMWGEFGG